MFFYSDLHIHSKYSRATKRKWQGIHRDMPISPFLEKIENDLLNLSKFDKVFKEKDNSQQLSLF